MQRPSSSYFAIDFNPRSSCEERPGLLVLPTHPLQISIHAPHARSDLGYKRTMRHAGISIHAPHARSDHDRIHSMKELCISIHAPHARSDALSSHLLILPIISIHAPHARSDDIAKSTDNGTSDFNPRSSCEERLCGISVSALSMYISIHAPHARSDIPYIIVFIHLSDISIHAPHARSDDIRAQGCTSAGYFNPRSSCEERRSKMRSCRLILKFQSTLLMRGATSFLCFHDNQF